MNDNPTAEQCTKAPAVVWVVYDPVDNDIPIAFVGPHAEDSCHEHINEAIADGDIENAEKWVVRMYEAAKESP